MVKSQNIVYEWFAKHYRSYGNPFAGRGRCKREDRAIRREKRAHLRVVDHHIEAPTRSVSEETHFNIVTNNKQQSRNGRTCG